MRHERYMPAIMERCNLRVIIGKGGMGAGTQKACAKLGCVYLLAVGGAAQVLNDRIKKVLGVHFRREFGMTEAVWELEVVDFPAIVAIDARGRSINQRVRASSKRILGKLLKKGPPFGA
jgi:fumarate hydratase class I